VSNPQPSSENTTGEAAPEPSQAAAPENWFAPGTPRRPATDAERRALASVLRLRILRMCLYEPLTNREIAGRLGLNPATVLHHVRTLADQGFLAAGPARRGRRGSREIPYRATGKSWRLETGDVDRAPLVEAFIAEVGEVPVADVDASRLGLQLSPDHEEELRSRLATIFEEFASRPQDPGGKRLSLFLAIHPEP
jgi:DNA-binding transcriptional ArsR family regulator